MESTYASVVYYYSGSHSFCITHFPGPSFGTELSNTYLHSNILWIPELLFNLSDCFFSVQSQLHIDTFIFETDWNMIRYLSAFDLISDSSLYLWPELVRE